MISRDSSPSYATVVLDSAMKISFDYSVPLELQKRVNRGSKVLVPFRTKKVWGYVVDLPQKPRVAQVKMLLDAEKEDSFVSGTGLKLAKWISQYYCCNLATGLKAVFPIALRKNKKVEFDDPSQTEEVFLPEPTYDLTEEQKKILDLLFDVIKKKSYHPFLLFGVTGSGKTEIYLRAIKATLAEGKRAIVIVPEIALTPQTVERFRSRFTEEVSVWHSQLTPAERWQEWQKIKRGQTSIVIGARSAIFTPLPDVGLIVVDEEHEKSYKQGENPRYHARDLAVMRAYMEQAVILLGSATPCLESYFNVQKKKYELLTLTKRVDDRPMPEVKVIDMREVMKREKGTPVFSQELLQAIRERLEKKEQTILFLNRRGYSNFVLCRSCGFVLKCENCSLSLTYHQKESEGRCHFCGYSVKVGTGCPSCKVGKVSLLGLGTQKVEKLISKIFPQARVERLDSDSASKKGTASRILRAFQEGRVDILIGTQMIAKGLDFPRVTLTGVVLADVTLHVPDFRSGEYTFQLLTQVAGRAGRGEIEGEVIIQTFTPNHPSILAAKKHDFIQFYNQEINFREELNYPPFTHFLVITAAAKKEENVRGAMRQLKKELVSRINASWEVSGPMPAPLVRLQNKFRWQLILKGQRVLALNPLIQKLLPKIEREFSVYFIVDVDPASML